MSDRTARRDACDLAPHSHLAVLQALGRGLDPRVVYEFGSGEGSTRAFLDRAQFQRLTKLVSFESDPAWAARMRDTVRDSRWEIVECSPRAMVQVAARRDDRPDLAFVDNADWIARWAVLLADLAPIYVLHDAENAIYDGVTALFDHKIFLSPIPDQPATALLSDQAFPAALIAAVADLPRLAR